MVAAQQQQCVRTWRSIAPERASSTLHYAAIYAVLLLLSVFLRCQLHFNSTNTNCSSKVINATANQPLVATVNAARVCALYLHLPHTLRYPPLTVAVLFIISTLVYFFSLRSCYCYCHGYCYFCI